MTKNHVAPYFSCLLMACDSAIDDVINITRYLWQCQWHHMTPLPVASCDANANVSSHFSCHVTLMPMSVVLHN